MHQPERPGSDLLAVFKAIADPTRRAILEGLAEGEQPATAFLDQFAISQPALSQHLKVLRAAGLVDVRRDGRRRLYRLRAEPLRLVHDWAAHFERFWNDRLDRLGAWLDAHPEGDPDAP